MMYNILLTGALVYFICLILMFAYIDNLYYNKVDKLNKRTIYWSRVIVSATVIFSISLLFIGIIYNMRENKIEYNKTYSPETPEIETPEMVKPKKTKPNITTRRNEAALLNEYTLQINKKPNRRK